MIARLRARAWRWRASGLLVVATWLFRASRWLARTAGAVSDAAEAAIRQAAMSAARAP